MPHITLNPEQEKTLATSLEPVEVRSAQGQILAVIQPVWSKEDVEHAKQVLANPESSWHSSEKVQARLRALEQA